MKVHIKQLVEIRELNQALNKQDFDMKRLQDQAN